MASAYKSYPAVEKVQTFLNDELAKGTITGAPLEVDGKWGPLTTAAFWAWLATQPEGTDLTLVSIGVLSDAELTVVQKAQQEHTQIEQAKGEGNGALPPPPPTGTTQPSSREGWGTTTWVLIGAAVAGAGLLGWWWMKQRKAKALPASATAGLEGLDELDGLGEGEMVSLGRPKGRKSLGCGCGG